MTLGPLINKIGSYLPFALSLAGYCTLVSTGTAIGFLLVVLGSLQGGTIGVTVYGLSYFGAILLYLATRLSYEHNRETYFRYMKTKGFMGTLEQNAQAYADYLKQLEERKAQKELAKKKHL